MGTITILKETTKNPITLMGERAGICWGADISNAEKNYQRGLDCIKSGHGRDINADRNIPAILQKTGFQPIRHAHSVTHDIALICMWAKHIPNIDFHVWLLPIRFCLHPVRVFSDERKDTHKLAWVVILHQNEFLVRGLRKC